jgi:NhaC family Na+:H+ antiporter
MNTFSGKQILFLIVITLLGILSSVFFHFPLVIGFFPGFISLLLLARSKKNLGWAHMDDELERGG